MRKVLLTLFVLVVAFSAFGFRPAETTVISGDYVEARTASVFAGACHYNGEVVTTGRDAVMAWSINSGVWKGTDLTGVRVFAAVSSTANLGEAQATRKSEIIIDNSATERQAAAALELLKTKYGASLGQVVSVRRAPVSFRHESHDYKVQASDLAAISVEAMPNDDCCRMPNLVWYSPLVPLANRKVGYTVKAFYAGGRLGDMWQRADENSAFYGRFTL